MIGFHVQSPPTNGREAIRKLPPGTPVLAVDNVQYLAQVKADNPDVFTILRHHADWLQVFPLDWTMEQWREHARRFFRTFINKTFTEHAWAVDAVKGFNEIWANSQSFEERRARIWWTKAVAYVWFTEYRSLAQFSHIRLVIGSAAIGNDMPVEIAEVARLYDCIVSYHAYWYTVDGQQPEWEWPTLSGRWEEMDIAWKQAGYEVDWLMTECGPFESAVTGWRSGVVCGGDAACYLRSIKYWLDNAADTDAFREGRLLGGVLFTTFAGGDWPAFDTQMPELATIADFVTAWAPPPPPEPEPPPEPYRVVVNLLPQDATLDEKWAVLQRVHEARESLLQSADDAARLAANGNERSTVKAWGYTRWPGDIAAYLADRGVPKIVELDFPEEQ